MIKVNLPTHVCLKRNCRLLFILKHWSYAKCKDVLHTLNIYIYYIYYWIYIYIIMNIYIYTNIYIYYWIYIYIYYNEYIYIYIIPAKEHQVVDRSGAEEILISETLLWKYLEYVHLILQNYKN